MKLAHGFGSFMALAGVSLALFAVQASADSAATAARADVDRASNTLNDLNLLFGAIKVRQAAALAAAPQSGALAGPELGNGMGQNDDPPVIVDYPPIPRPNVKGLIVLFSGKPEEVAANWLKDGTDQPAAWQIQDGAMVAHGGNIISREKFRDFQLHVEFKVPFRPGKHGQERGNSGVGLQSHYEIQVLDSYGFKEPGSGDCGAVYSQHAPLVNACRPPLNWQTYDITFRAPRFDAAGKRTEKARVTVIQNGVIVQNNQEIEGPTGIGGKDPLDKPGPIYLQDHGNPTEFRNVWVLPLPEQGVTRYEPH